VPKVLPLPKAECDRRGLKDNCQPPRSWPPSVRG